MFVNFIFSDIVGCLADSGRVRVPVSDSPHPGSLLFIRNNRFSIALSFSDNNRGSFFPNILPSPIFFFFSIFLIINL